MKQPHLFYFWAADDKYILISVYILFFLPLQWHFKNYTSDKHIVNQPHIEKQT